MAPARSVARSIQQGAHVQESARICDVQELLSNAHVPIEHPADSSFTGEYLSFLEELLRISGCFQERRNIYMEVVATGLEAWKTAMNTKDCYFAFFSFCKESRKFAWK